MNLLYEIPKQKSHLEKTRDVFLFMCYTGLRYSDVANLKRCYIQENRIEIVTEKTNVVLSIDLNSHSRRILQKYERFRFKKDAALPMISNQKMNQNLHELCKQAGFNKLIRIINYQGCQRIDEIKPKYEVIGTHTGRRSFICNAISMGIPPQGKYLLLANRVSLEAQHIPMVKHSVLSIALSGFSSYLCTQNF